MSSAGCFISTVTHSPSVPNNFLISFKPTLDFVTRDVHIIPSPFYISVCVRHFLVVYHFPIWSDIDLGYSQWNQITSYSLNSFCIYFPYVQLGNLFHTLTNTSVGLWQPYVLLEHEFHFLVGHMLIPCNLKTPVCCVVLCKGRTGTCT